MFLQKPGEVIPKEIPRLVGYVAVCEVPDAHTGRRIIKGLMEAADKPERSIDVAKKIMGRVIKKIESSGESLVLDVNDSGDLTEDCLSQIMPLIPNLWLVISDFVSISEDERKN